jgi:hypothetical protein
MVNSAGVDLQRLDRSKIGENNNKVDLMLTIQTTRVHKGKRS